jgi:hypothetical protein
VSWALLLLLVGCASQVETFPKSGGPLGVGAGGAPPVSGDDTGEGDTGEGDSGEGDSGETDSGR